MSKTAPERSGKGSVVVVFFWAGCCYTFSSSFGLVLVKVILGKVEFLNVNGIVLKSRSEMNLKRL